MTGGTGGDAQGGFWGTPPCLSAASSAVSLQTSPLFAEAGALGRVTLLGASAWLL